TPCPLHMTCYRDPDLASIRRDGDAIEATIAERPAAREPHPAHGHDSSVLAHADYRVVAAVRHIEVGAFFERRVAGPVGSFRFDRGRGQINWLIERIGVDATDRSHSEDHAVVNQVNDRDRVLKRLANVKDSRRRVVENHTEPRRCAAVVVVVLTPSAVAQGTHGPRRRKPVYGFAGVSLDDAAVSERYAKNGPPGAVRRPAEKRGPDSASAERARENLHRQTRREIACEH